MDALKNWSYSTGLSQKKNEEFLKAAQSLKIDIVEFERLLSKKAEFSKILPYHMHSKSANNIVSNSLEELSEQQKVVQQRIKSNIAKVWIAPSTLEIKEDKKMGTIETKTKQQLWSDKKGKDYGFDKYTYEGNFAQANRELLDDMFDICEERSKGDVQKAYSESSDYVQEQEDIERLTRALQNDSLSSDRKDELQEELEQKQIKLSNLGNNSLNASERHDYKKKIISFWKYIVAKEVSPKKQQSLLLTEGGSARDNFLAGLNFTPGETITTPTTEKDTIVQQNDTKDGIEPENE